MTDALVLDAVTKQYAGVDRATINALSLTVERGEFVVLLGPSGCGKSTVLRLIAGLIPATGGRIAIDGRDVTTISPKDRNVAMVFQNYALFPHLSVYDNLAFGMRIRKTPRAQIDSKVRTAAASTGLVGFLEKKPSELSGGQSQRVALARALVRDPAVFLFDEPLSNLDPDLRGRMRAELAEFRRGVDGAMIYVTHDQLEAMTLADRIVVMSEGRVRQIGAPLDVYNEPANQFVASFLGSTPMNFIAPLPFRAFFTDEMRLPEIERVPSDGTVGVRPEDIYLSDRRAEGVRASEPFSGRVTLLEALGDGAIVHLRVGDQPLVARLRHQFRARPDDIVRVVIDLARVRTFDGRGERVM